MSMLDRITDLQNFTSRDLISFLKVIRAKYALYKLANPDLQDEEMINLFLIVKDLLLDRKAFLPGEGYLDTEASEFQKFAAITSPIPYGEPYAPVLPSGNAPLDNPYRQCFAPDMISSSLKSFLAASPIAWLVGGIMEHPSESNDVDVLISTPSSEELEKIIKFRISRSFPSEIRDRIHFLCEQKGYVGPFTDCLPLYRLLVERIPNLEILKMAEINLRVKDSAKFKAQAEKALEKNFITVGEFYLPVKPVRGYLPGKLQTLDLFLDLYDEYYSYPALSSKKYDGMRILIHKDGDKITIFSEDGKLQTMLPRLREEIKGLKPKKCVIEAELERWNYKIGQHLPRETVNPDIEDDSDLTSNVFECLVFEGLIPKELNEELNAFDSNPEDWKSKFVNSHSDTLSEPSIKVDLQVHKYPALIRFKFLELLGIDQKTVKEPKADHRLNLVPHFRCDSRKELKEKTEDLRFMEGSEGNVVSAGIVKYHLTSGTRPYQMLKFHNSVSFRAMVLKSIETKTEGIFTIEYGIPSKDLPEKFAEKDDEWKNLFSQQQSTALQDPSQPAFYYVGKTFTTTEEAPAGSSIEVECETLNVVRVKDGLAVSAWAPRFIALSSIEPNKLQEVIDMANKNHVAEFKLVISKDQTFIDPPAALAEVLNVLDPTAKAVVFYFYKDSPNWDDSGTFTASANPIGASLNPFGIPSAYVEDELSDPYLASLKKWFSYARRQQSLSSKEIQKILDNYQDIKDKSKTDKWDIELTNWNNKLYEAKLEKNQAKAEKEMDDFRAWLRNNNYKFSNDILADIVSGDFWDRLSKGGLEYAWQLAGMEVRAGSPVKLITYSKSYYGRPPLFPKRKPFVPKALRPEPLGAKIEALKGIKIQKGLKSTGVSTTFSDPIEFGGQGSGYFDHPGRPGQVGGSLPSSHPGLTSGPPLKGENKLVLPKDPKLEDIKRQNPFLDPNIVTSINKKVQENLDFAPALIQSLFELPTEMKGANNPRNVSRLTRLLGYFSRALKTPIERIDKSTGELIPVYDQSSPFFPHVMLGLQLLSITPLLAGTKYSPDTISPDMSETEIQFEWDKKYYKQYGPLYLESKYGLQWLDSSEGLDYLTQVRSGGNLKGFPPRVNKLKNKPEIEQQFEWDKYYYDKLGSKYLVDRYGQDWLNTPEGQDWTIQVRNRNKELNSILPNFRKMSQDMGPAQLEFEWDVYLYRQFGDEYLDEKYGRDWIYTDKGLDYFFSVRRGKKSQAQPHSAKTKNISIIKSQFDTDFYLFEKLGKDYLVARYGRDWVNSEEGQDYSNAIREGKPPSNFLSIHNQMNEWRRVTGEKLKFDKKFAEDPLQIQIIPQVRFLLKKLTIAANSLESLQKDDSQKLLEEIIKIRSQILSILTDNNLESIEIDDLVLSSRKVPTTFEITNEQNLVHDLRERKLERFISVKEEVQLEELKKFLLSPEVTNSTDFKLPHGIKKSDDHYALYMFQKYSEDNSDDFQIFYFYEIPYYPQKESNAQLADAWRLMCAHYATWKNTSGMGITFTKDQIADNAIKAVKEIKERISKKEMVHTFEPNKMQDSSKELYELAKKALPDDLRDIGEQPRITEFGGPGSGHFGHLGRLGHIGGSMPSSVSSYPSQLIKTQEIELTDLSTEGLMVFDVSGKLFFKNISDSSSKTEWKSPSSDLSQYVISHNHPSGASFSLSDVKNAIIYNIGESRVITRQTNRDCVRYSLSIDYDKSLLSASEVYKTISHLYFLSDARVYLQLLPLLRSGDISIDEANETHYDKVWEDVSIKAKDKKIFFKYSKDIEKWID